MSIGMYTRINICGCAYMLVHTQNIRIHIYADTSTNACTHVCTGVCVFMCMLYIFVHVYMCMFTRTLIMYGYTQITDTLTEILGFKGL